MSRTAVVNFTKRFFQRWIRHHLLATIVVILLGSVVLGIRGGFKGYYPNHVNVNNAINDGFVMGNETGELVHFVQISDTHITSFEEERTDAFRKFCRETIKLIGPAFVLHTGDLTDGKGSKGDWTQQPIDWATYRKALEDYGLFDRGFWVDIRGNHDSYGAALWNSPLNLYNQFAVYGKDSNSTFRSNNLTFSTVYSEKGTNDTAIIEFTYKSPSGNSNFQFLSIDLIPQTAFSALADLWGYVHPARAQILTDRLKNSKSTYNQSIVMGHYPIGAMPRKNRVFEGKSQTLNSIAKEIPFMAFLCGHVHQRNYYNMQTEGFYELELADFKINRYFRVFAFDHSIYSFTDVKLDDYPIVLITNPKDSRFLSQLDPLHRIASSTHIRTLIILPNNQTFTAEAFIDGTSLGFLSYSGSGHLWTVPWNPQSYKSKTHNLKIVIKDSNSNLLKEISQPFSIDGTATYWETISPLNYFSHISYADAFYGIAMAVLLFLLILFLLAPKGLKLILQRKGRWEDFESRMKAKFEYEDNIYQNVRDGVKAPGNLWTWQIEEILYEYSNIHKPVWLFLTGAVLWTFAMPAFIGPLDNDKTWGVIFLHSVLIHGQYWTNYEMAFPLLLVDLGMLIPSLALAAKATHRSHFLEFSRLREGRSPNVKSGHFLVPGIFFLRRSFHGCSHSFLLKSKGTWGLMFVQFVGFVLLIVYSALAFGAGTIFCSPICWIYFCTFIMDAGLIHYELRQVRQNQITSMGDEEGLTVVPK